MRGILKVGSDFFVYFDSEIGLVRRMERNDAYKMLRFCGGMPTDANSDCVLVDAISDCVLIDAIKLKKFIIPAHDFLEIPYEGDLDSAVIRYQDDLSKFTVADVDALFWTDDDCDDCDDRDDLDDYADIYRCGNCDDCELQDECDYVNNYDALDSCDDCDVG